jgi:hypothetical protein
MTATVWRVVLRVASASSATSCRFLSIHHPASLFVSIIDVTGPRPPLRVVSFTDNAHRWAADLATGTAQVSSFGLTRVCRSPSPHRHQRLPAQQPQQQQPPRSAADNIELPVRRRCRRRRRLVPPPPIVDDVTVAAAAETDTRRIVAIAAHRVIGHGVPSESTTPARPLTAS